MTEAEVRRRERAVLDRCTAVCRGKAIDAARAGGQAARFACMDCVEALKALRTEYPVDDAVDP